MGEEEKFEWETAGLNFDENILKGRKNEKNMKRKVKEQFRRNMKVKNSKQIWREKFSRNKTKRKYSEEKS